MVLLSELWLYLFTYYSIYISDKTKLMLHTLPDPPHLPS